MSPRNTPNPEPRGDDGAREHTPRPGPLIIIGGHEQKEGRRVILREIAARLKGGRLVLATIASHRPEGYLESYQEGFRDLGVTDIQELYIEDRAEAADPEKLALLDGAAGVFFSGGDQLRITSQIGDTPIEAKVRELHEAGAVIAGTSAGASVMSDLMLVSGPSGASYRVGDLRLGRGLGLVRDVIIDQHFAERGRIGRLLGAVAQNPSVLGIGIDEDTAIIVRLGGFRVIGSGAVYVVDGAGVTHSNVAEGRAERPLSITDVRLHVLGHGDAYHLGERRPTCAPDVRESEALAQGG